MQSVNEPSDQQCVEIFRCTECEMGEGINYLSDSLTERKIYVSQMQHEAVTCAFESSAYFAKV